MFSRKFISFQLRFFFGVFFWRFFKENLGVGDETQKPLDPEWWILKEAHSFSKILRFKLWLFFFVFFFFLRWYFLVFVPWITFYLAKTTSWRIWYQEVGQRMRANWGQKLVFFLPSDGLEVWIFFVRRFWRKQSFIKWDDCSCLLKF